MVMILIAGRDHNKKISSATKWMRHRYDKVYIETDAANVDIAWDKNFEIITCGELELAGMDNSCICIVKQGKWVDEHAIHLYNGLRNRTNFVIIYDEPIPEMNFDIQIATDIFTARKILMDQQRFNNETNNNLKDIFESSDACIILKDSLTIMGEAALRTPTVPRIEATGSRFEESLESSSEPEPENEEPEPELEPEQPEDESESESEESEESDGQTESESENENAPETTVKPTIPKDIEVPCVPFFGVPVVDTPTPKTQETKKTPATLYILEPNNDFDELVSYAITQGEYSSLQVQVIMLSSNEKIVDDHTLVIHDRTFTGADEIKKIIRKHFY